MLPDYFIPINIKPEKREKASLIISIALTVSGLYILFTLVYFLKGENISAFVTLAASIIVFAILFYYKKTSSTKVFINLFLFEVYLQLIHSTVSHGGVNSPSAYFLIFVPMIAMIMHGRNYGFFWSGVTSISYIILLAGNETVLEKYTLYPASQELSDIGIYLIGGTVVLTALSAVLISMQDKAKKELKNEKESIEQKVFEATEELKNEKEKSEQESKIQIETQIKEAEYVNGFIQNLLNGFDRFSHGDLTFSLELADSSKIDNEGIIQYESRLINGFNETIVKVRDTISQVIKAVDQTTGSSNTISSSIEQMAAGSQEQSVKTSEVATAVEEMTKTITETAFNASSASDLAKESGNIAKEGGEVVVNTVDGMNKIAEVVLEASGTVKELGKNSGQIGEIIQVIDDIADQTNLLALNAAIEAARAGEQGRGFAVVADEVRKLAERTTKATKEISQMIQSIQKDTAGAVSSIEVGTLEVQKGKDLVNKASLALTRIIQGADKVVDVINQVAAAGEEQSATAEQISRSIEGINQVVNESAGGIQQISEAAFEMNGLTENLRDLVSHFNIGDSSVNQDNYNLQILNN